MISKNAFILLVLAYLVIFTVQFTYFPDLLEPEPIEYQLMPPVRQMPSVKPIPEPEKSEPAPMPVEPVPKIVTVRTLLFNGSRKISHYGYTESGNYPFTIDVAGDVSLIRYAQHRFHVPLQMVDRVFLNHSSRTASGTCLFHIRCIQFGSYKKEVPVSYSLFNVPSFYDQIGPYLDIEVNRTTAGGLFEEKETVVAHLANGYRIRFFEEYRFPILVVDSTGKVKYAAQGFRFNNLPEGGLHLFSYVQQN